MTKKWTAVLGTFMIVFLEVGVLKSLSVLFPDITKDLNISSGELGMYTAISHGITISLGLVTNALLRKFSPRSLAILGGAISTVSLSLCYIASTGKELATYIVIYGCGYGLLLMPGKLSVTLAFGEHYVLPLSIALTGSGVGMMVLPLAVNALKDVYSWRGALLILGATNLHSVVAGALFEPTIITATSKSHRTDKDIVSETTKDMPNPKKHCKMPAASDSEQQTSRGSSGNQNLCLNNNVASRLCNYSGCDVILKHPMSICVVVMAILHGVTYTGWTVFVILNAEAKGTGEQLAAMMGVAGGFGNIVGRVLPGAINKIRPISSRVLFVVFGVIGAIPLCANILVTAYPILFAFAMLNGMAIGAKIVLKYVVGVDVLPEDYVSTALALSMFGQGLGEMLGGYIAGSIFDRSASLDHAFLALGFVDEASVVVTLLSLLHDHIRQKN